MEIIERFGDFILSLFSTISFNMVKPYKEEKEPRIKVLRKTIDILKSNYAFPEDEINFNGKLLLKFMTLFLLFGPILALGIFNFLYRSSRDKIYAEQVDCFVLLIQLLMILSYMFTIINRGKHSVIFLHKLSDYTYGKPPNFDVTSEEWDKWTVLLYNITKCIVLVYHAHQYMNNSYCIGRDVRGDHRYFCGATYPLWFPFEFGPVTRILFLLANTVFAFKYFPAMVVHYVFVMACLNLIALRVKHLKLMLGNITKHNSTRDEAQRNVYLCQKYHSTLPELLRKYNEAEGNAPLSPYMLMPILIATLFYQIIQNKNVVALIDVVPAFCGITTVCLTGQYLQSESESLDYSVYNLPWYKMDTKTRKTVQIFLARTQAPLNIKVKPFGELNNLILLRILKGCYSFLTFLVQMSKDE